MKAILRAKAGITMVISAFVGSTNGSTNVNQISLLGMICKPKQINICLSFVHFPFWHLSDICLAICLNLFGITNLTQNRYLIKFVIPFVDPTNTEITLVMVMAARRKDAYQSFFFWLLALSARSSYS